MLLLSCFSLSFIVLMRCVVLLPCLAGASSSAAIYSLLVAFVVHH
ncbi:hypothetical protein BVRB_7g166700 [Beta vulgaris subsp. vulgaris]|nr:hypothetical protein BVRB_7g166700 [Beta vulgaris subsp. vulgaris]